MQIRGSLVLSAVAAAVACGVPLGSAHAHAYPAKQINMIVLFPPGGEPAAFSRAVASDFNRHGKIIQEAGIQANGGLVARGQAHAD